MPPQKFLEEKMKKGMRNCAKASAFAMAVAIFCPVNAGAATVNESKPMVLNSKYTASLPVSSETFYKFTLKSKTKIMLDAAYDAGYFEIIGASGSVLYEGTKDEHMNGPQDWTLKKKMTLQKGTYYLHLYTKGEWAGDSMTFVIKNMNAPKKPVVKKIKSKKGIVAGKTSANVRVYVKRGKTLRTVIADAKGKFSVKIKKLKKGQKVKVWAKSVNQVSSKKVTVKVK